MWLGLLAIGAAMFWGLHNRAITPAIVVATAPTAVCAALAIRTWEWLWIILSPAAALAMAIAPARRTIPLAEHNSSIRYCASCGYVLRGSATERCPECGHVIATCDAPEFRIERPSVRNASGWITIALASWIALSISAAVVFGKPSRQRLRRIDAEGLLVGKTIAEANRMLRGELPIDSLDGVHEYHTFHLGTLNAPVVEVEVQNGRVVRADLYDY